MVATQYAHNIQRQTGGVAAGQNGSTVNQLVLDRGQLLEQLEAPVQHGLNIKGLPGHVEEEGDMLDHGQIGR